MKKLVGLAIAFLCMSGCATVLKGSNQTVAFNSEPDGAQVIIDGVPMGMTPTSLSLKKNKFKNVMFKKEGYNQQTLALDTAYDALALLNVFWDLSTTDLLTGNAYEYAPNAYFVKLSRSSTEEAAPAAPKDVKAPKKK